MSVTIKDIDRGWDRILRSLKNMDRQFVKIGVLEGAGAEENGTDLAAVATYNEFGTSDIPSRPFMRQTFEKNREQINERIAKAKDKIFLGEDTPESALGKIGVWYTGETQNEISSGDFVKNAPATIARKKSSKPLIHTGRLHQSINWEIDKE